MLELDGASDIPLYQQIYGQLKQDILSGALPFGTRLVSTRALAKDLRAGRNTVENAYAQLALEGYVTPVPGSGFVVNPVQYDLHAEPAPLPFKTRAHAPEKPTPPLYDFYYGNMTAAFPHEHWRRIVTEILAQGQSAGMHEYGDPGGDPELRAEIARYLYRSRGVRCTPEQVIVRSGVQSALAVVVRLFQHARLPVAMEEPGYLGARVVFQDSGFAVQPIPVGPEGMDLEKLAASPARLVYVTPSHQFPTGAVMPIQRRQELLRWAEERDGLIIEDDYDSEFRYNGRPIPSLQSIDRHGRVLYLGTFSKALSPGLRAAYLVLPERFMPGYKEAFSGWHCPVPWLEQKALAAFMAGGHWERHLRKACQSNRKKHDVLVETATRLFGDAVRLHGRGAGAHLLLEFMRGMQEKELVEKAADMGVKVYPASPYWLDVRNYAGNCVFLGYATLTEAEIPKAVNLLGQAWLG